MTVSTWWRRDWWSSQC